jgi:hypothetical protein
MDRVLRQSLREEDAPAAAGCLDAGTLAAWIDGELAPELLAEAESHAAGCGRCQAVLSAMARTAPPIAPRAWWPASATIRWLVPAAAAATAMALWIAVAPPGNRPEEPTRSSDSDRAAGTPSPSLTPAPAPPRAEAPLASPTRIPEQSAAKNSSTGTVAGGQAAPAPSERKTEGAAADTVANAPESVGLRRDRIETAKENEEALSAPPKIADLQGRAPAPSPPALATPPVPPAAEATGPPVTEARGFRTALTLRTDVVSPDPMSRWRTGVPGLVYRTIDGGATWIRQETGSASNITAGSSPSRDVCWLVGRAGSVLLSAEGTTWQPRPFPEKVDLVAVAAVDAKTATVTTADGRRFSTLDGGATWSIAAPQESPAAPF